MTTIHYDSGGCGSGKTYQALQTIIDSGGRHIYACDRKEAIRERTRTLRELRPDETPLLRTIYSDHDFRGIGPSVLTEIEALPDELAGHSDVVVFITHEALKLANWEAFAGQGWSLWIDEVPHVLDNDSHAFCRSWKLLSRAYELRPVEETRWSEVHLRDLSLDVATLALDDALQVIRPMHRRVADPRRQVFANIKEWAELAEKRKRVSWYSLWSPADLDAFSAVFMLGNGLETSATVQLWKAQWPEVEWLPMELAMRPFLPRRVSITYFAERHCASRSLFGSDAGKSNLRQIARYLAQRHDYDLIWTCNEPEKELLRGMPGQWLRPKQAGSNSYEGYAAVAPIYTSKPDDSLRVVYKQLGVDPVCHTRTAEYETILQFACRGSIRLPHDQRPFRIYVYDKAQAQYLLDYFDRDPRSYAVARLELENLGFAFDVRDSRRGRKKKVMSAAEREAAAERRRKADRERKRRKRPEKKTASAP